MNDASIAGASLGRPFPGAAAVATARESSRQLATLLRREHAALADFLVALADFDARETWRPLGYAGLFDYLHRELGLSRGAAHYRKVAARLVRTFPGMVEPIRDGRLCYSTILELAKVVTPENHAGMLPRFFHRSRQEAQAVVAEIRPAAVVPVRAVVTALPASRASATAQAMAPGGQAGGLLPGAETSGESLRPQSSSPDELALIEVTSDRRDVRRADLGGQRLDHHAPQTAQAARHPPSVVPLTADLRRLHVTVSKQFLAKLERARAGQSHVQPGATAEQVLEAALDLLLAAQEKRRASVPPRVKREVRRRDEGRCQWRLHDGAICGSTVRTEIDHVVPRGRGGPSTVDNCRVLCDRHNREAARQVYGDDLIDRFAPRAPVAREPDGGPPVAREPEAPRPAAGKPGTSQASSPARPPRPSRLCTCPRRFRIVAPGERHRERRRKIR